MKLRKLMSRVPAHPTRTPRRFIPRLQPLEDRLAPATFTVNTTFDSQIAGDGKLSLREAISRANATAKADVIVVPAGEYGITIEGQNEDSNNTGDLDITNPVTIVGRGASHTIIEGRWLDRVFHVLGSGPGSIRVNLQGLMITQGRAFDGAGLLMGNADVTLRSCKVNVNLADWSGAGISNLSHPGTGNLKLIGCTVEGNLSSSGDGAGIYLANARLTCQKSVIRGNNAGASGGGIAGDRVKLTGCRVLSNSAMLWGGGVTGIQVTLTDSIVASNAAADRGGGLFATSATLLRSTVARNKANGGGGGIFVQDGELRASASTVRANVASGNGGGIRAGHASLTYCTVSGNNAYATGLAPGNGGGISVSSIMLRSSTVSGNHAAGGGGGIHNTTDVTLINSTISGNHAAGLGGGVYTEPPSPVSTGTVLNCTIVENSASEAGGIYREGTLGVFNVANSIIALNLVPYEFISSDVKGQFTSGGNNLIGSDVFHFFNGVLGDIVGTYSNPADPKLGPLALNGGRTMTHALLAGSRAIDAGKNKSISNPVDQRGLGFPRVKDGNGDGIARVDIGAHER
jgi:hypothetical protein